MFDSPTLKSLVLWEKPFESAIVASLFVGTVLVFGIMNYTFLTFICRVVQLATLLFGASAYLGKPIMTYAEIISKAKTLHEAALPAMWSGVEYAAKVITWEDRTVTLEIFVATMVLASVGTFFSDLTLVFFLTVGMFVAPVTYMHNKSYFDDTIFNLKAGFENMLQHTAEHLKSAASSLSPHNSPTRSSGPTAGAATEDESHPKKE